MNAYAADPATKGHLSKENSQRKYLTEELSLFQRAIV